ncbi:MAG: oxidoreductase, partial [Pseudomonadota bacterium]
MPPVLALLAYLAPLSLIALFFASYQVSGMRPRALVRWSQWTAIGSVGIAFCMLLSVLATGPATSPLIGVEGVGFSIRMDALSG